MSRIKNPFSMYLNTLNDNYELRGSLIDVCKEIDQAKDNKDIDKLFILASSVHNASVQ